MKRNYMTLDKIKPRILELTASIEIEDKQISNHRKAIDELLSVISEAKKQISKIQLSLDQKNFAHRNEITEVNTLMDFLSNKEQKRLYSEMQNVRNKIRESQK